MKGRLTESQKQYVLEHLGHHAVIGSELMARFRFGETAGPGTPFIHFPLSEKALDFSRVIRIDDIPILYPVSKETEAFYTIQNNNLVFHHDLLKSAFHLLSGYEEFNSGASDQYGRFPFKESIQYKLGFVAMPIVNYYFDIILEGLEQFCIKNRIPFDRTPAFSNPVLMLSHDIDRIDAYHFYETFFKFKQLTGLSKSPYNLAGRVQVALSSLYYFLNPFSKHNPFWSFDFLNKTESDRRIKSTYYFLEKDELHDNSRYRFNEKRIIKLIRELSSEGHEIGLHGTIQSSTDQEAMDRTLEHLKEVSPDPVTGIRQHLLKFQHSDTALIQENAGLKYDASLGFAEHEGFRNSYCWPFRLYDFRSDRPSDVWEIPLTVMEGTLFYYRELDLDSAMSSIKNLTEEVMKFNGIFSLLWHNHFFDEKEIPGITAFYLRLLDYLKSCNMEGITGKEILQRMQDQQS